MAEKFNVVFNGKTEPNQDIEDVKQRLTTVLKLDAAGIARLFDGSAVIIKKNVDAATAEKYSQAFKGSGAVCIIEPVGVVPQPTSGPKTGTGFMPQTQPSPSGAARHTH